MVLRSYKPLKQSVHELQVGFPPLASFDLANIHSLIAQKWSLSSDGDQVLKFGRYLSSLLKKQYKQCVSNLLAKLLELFHKKKPQNIIKR